MDSHRARPKSRDSVARLIITKALPVGADSHRNVGFAGIDVFCLPELS